MNKHLSNLLNLLLIAALVLIPIQGAAAQPASPDEPQPERPFSDEDIQKLAAPGSPQVPPLFIENDGRWDERIRFAALAGEQILWIVQDGFWLTYLQPDQDIHLKFTFLGARPALEPQGLGEPVAAGGMLQRRVVRYAGLYPGVDLEVEAGAGGFTYRLLERDRLAAAGWLAAQGVDDLLEAARMQVTAGDGLDWSETLSLAASARLLQEGEERPAAQLVTAQGEFELPAFQLDAIVLSSAASAITASEDHTCAVTSSGGVKCWGYNFSGQLGDGTRTNRLTPVNVAGLLSGVSAIAAGKSYTCALTSAGGVKCWGENDKGQLGDGTMTDRLTPVDVVGLTSGVKAIAAGDWHTCALTNGGGVKCWGDNFDGQLGDGTMTDRLTPVDVAGLTSGVKAIAAGWGHTCAVTNSGGVKCWGGNWDGRLGDGTTNDHPTPVDVAGLTAGVSAIAAGDWHTCAVTSGGGARCWGWNEYGQLGDGTVTTRLTPVGVSGLSSGVSAIAGGDWHTCAVTSSGGVKCWGDNDDGQLGDDTWSDRLTPVNVVGLSSGVSAVAAGRGHTCALTSSGGVKCWGDNLYGQLGNGKTIGRLTPVDVIGLEGKPTIILLPGIMGSRLYNTPLLNCNQNAKGEIWLDLFKFLMHGNVLYLNDEGNAPVDPCNKITAEGIMDQTAFRDAYSPFINYFQQRGYRVESFAYDWRLSLTDNANKLDDIINGLKSGKVVLVGHSMGGLLAWQYITSTTRARKVEQVISVGAPYWGAPKLAFNMRSGAVPEGEFQMSDTTTIGVALPLVHRIIRNSPGCMQLLPSDAYFNAMGSPYYWNGNNPLGTFDATRDFFASDPGIFGAQNYHLINRAREFHKGIDNFNNLESGPYTVIYTNHLPTPVVYREYQCMWGLSHCWDVQYAPGDGTVPWISAALFGNTGAAQVIRLSSGQVSQNHGDLLKDESVLDRILNVLDPATAMAMDESTSAPISYIKISVAGDAKVSIMDSSGNTSGIDADGMVYNEIPDSIYDVYIHSTTILVPSEDKYELNLQLNDGPPPQVTVSEIVAPTQEETFDPIRRAVFVSVPLAVDGIARLELDLTAGFDSLIMSIDQEADGIPDFSIAPDSVIDNPDFLFDYSMPVTGVSLEGSRDRFEYFKGTVTASLSAIDEGSGVLRTEYSLDKGATWQKYDLQEGEPIVFEAQEDQMFLARSIDVAGNQEFPWSETIIRPKYDVAHLKKQALVFLDNVPTLSLSGSLPTPCHILQVDVGAAGAGGRIDAEVYSLANPNRFCAQVLTPFEDSVALSGLEPGSYTLWVNNKQVGTFEIQ